MSKYLFILSIIVFLFKTETVFSAETIYDVNNIQVSGKLNSNLDNNKLIEEAFRKAFLIFINKTLLEKDIETLSKTNIQIIKDFIFTHQITSQKKSIDEEIILTVNVKFDPKKINNYLSINNISYADISEISISILPILRKENNLFIFSDNFFYNEWNKTENDKKNTEAQLINYNLALENAEDLFYINNNRENLELIDINKLNSLSEEKNKIFLIFTLNEDAKVFIKAYFNEKEVIKNITLNNNSTDDYNSLIMNVKDLINQIWKEQNLIDINTPAYLDIIFDIKKINDFLKFRTFLDTIDIIDNYSILEITNKYAKIRMKYKGKISNLREKFLNEKININIENNEWSLSFN
ncbi:MAG: hypothetical protein ACO3P6_00390 [Pelagibacteraceae bacterium]|jgi:hypothetical protein